MIDDKPNRAEFLRTAARWGLLGALGALGVAAYRRGGATGACERPQGCAGCPERAQCALVSPKEAGTP